MCGILGAFSPTQPTDGKFSDAFFEALKSVSHRGPDGFGFWSNGKDLLFFPRATADAEALEESRAYFESARSSVPAVQFGHRRLGIIDLSNDASQPMGIASKGSSRKNIWIVFNGEIYNYVELRTELEKLGATFETNGDTEVILRAYEYWGRSCFARFNGMWAIAIWDDRRHDLILSRDRIGVKPLYYTFVGGRIYFASEIKQLISIRKSYGLGLEWNPYRLYEFLTHAHQHHSEETFYKDIFLFRPGHFVSLPARPLSFEDLQSRIQRFWEFPDEQKIAEHAGITFEEAAAQLRNLLESSVELRLRSDVPVGSALSGGLDSSSIVSIIKRLNPHHQKTFSATFAGLAIDERRYAEMVIAGSRIEGVFVSPTSEELVRILPKLIHHQDGPFYSTSMFAQWEVFKAARAHGVPVMLDGQGADEVLAGYEGFITSYLKSVANNQGHLNAAVDGVRFLRNHPNYLLVRLNREVASRFDWMLLFTPDARNEIRARQAEVARSGDRSLFAQEKEEYKKDPLRDALYKATAGTSLPALLAFEDRNSMAFGVESRTPFLDYRFVSFAFSVPTHFHVRSGMRKALLREAMRGIIPETIRARKDKIGFTTPAGAWKESSFAQVRELAVANADSRIFDRKMMDQAINQSGAWNGWRALSALLATGQG